MKITSTTVPNKIKQYCLIGKKHKLYMRTGVLFEWFNAYHTMRIVAIAWDKNRPIGIAVVSKYGRKKTESEIGVYIKSKYRKQGIGTALAKRINKRIGKTFKCIKYNKKSILFYNSLGY